MLGSDTEYHWSVLPALARAKLMSGGLPGVRVLDIAARVYIPGTRASGAPAMPMMASTAITQEWRRRLGLHHRSTATKHSCAT